MSARRFPSGPWTGFYYYGAGSGKSPMDLRLTFARGRITGDGADPVGLFIIEGSYDEAGGHCSWTKTYVAAHDVAYSGRRSGKGITGTWTIESLSRGGFEIWPVDGDVEDLVEDEEEEAKLLEVLAVPQRPGKASG